MGNNRLEDFLSTGVMEQPSITCPACGSVMGLTMNGSYQMILTENSRQQVISVVQSYRSAIKNMERILDQHNAYGIRRVELKAYPHTAEESVLYPHIDQHGIYVTSGSVGIDKFAHELDRLNWFEKLTQLPVHSASLRFAANGDQTPQRKAGENVLDILVAGFEPGSITGPVMDLIFNQREVDIWTKSMLDKNRPGRAKPELIQLVMDVCPHIGQYLQDLLILEESKQVGSNNGNSASSKSDKLHQEAILRCQYIIALLLGHESPNVTERSKAVIKKGIPYVLPRLTVVSPQIFCNLLKSEVIIGTDHLKWSPELKTAVRQGSATSTSDFDNEQVIQEVTKLLGEEISTLVNFVCTGPIGYTSDVKPTPQNAEHAKTEAKVDEHIATCGWYPKSEPTHPVVLIGSPGTGKSAVMLTGLTTFYSNAAAIGTSIAFDSPADESLMKEYDARYWQGARPKPTPVHERLSIKLSLVTPSRPAQPTNYVFTDIPGQVVARCLTEEGPDPIVLNILSNAETIVFFFDLSIENTIREKLTQGDHNNTWKHVIDNFDRVKKDRPAPKDEITADASIGLQSEAMVSQLQLLQKLLNDLRLARSDEELKKVNFLCVFPKADLFVLDGAGDKEGNVEQYFLTPFFEYLEQEKVLVRSRQREGEGFIGKYSLVGSGAKMMQHPPAVHEETYVDRVTLQHKLLRQISDRALACIRNIGSAIEDDVDLEPLRQSLQDTIEVRLVDMLCSIFGQQNVYFLPVSALGEERKDDYKNNGTGSSQMNGKNPFNQKLSEYIFALPVILSILKR